MIKTYIPVDKREGKTRIRGFWKGSQGVCYDYLKQIDLEPCQLSYVKKHYKQEALFYREKGKAYIWYNLTRVEALKFQQYFSYDKQTRGFKDFLKDLLTKFGGFTIYIREQNYLIEVWT